MGQIIISMPLITHCPCTDNVRAKNKYWKINGQAIYNGSVDKFKRAIIVENMHRYVINSLDDSLLNLKIEKVQWMHYIFHTVKNHGSISRRNGKTCWKPAEPNYKSNWDIFNLASIWIKIIDDALTMAGVLVDDNTDVTRRGKYEMVEVDHIDDLELEIIINY